MLSHTFGVEELSPPSLVNMALPFAQAHQAEVMTGRLSSSH